MIDTLRVAGRWHVPSGSDWQTKTTRCKIGNTDAPGETITSKNKFLRCRGKAGIIETIEFSVPKLLFGTNEKLIRSQEDIDAALAMIEKIMGGPHDRIARMDLVWHFPIRTADFIRAFQFCKPKYIRRGKTVRETSISWIGSECALVAYDKLQEQKRGVGNYTRVELRFKTDRQIKKMFGLLQRPLMVDCWNCYRRAMLDMKPQPIPTSSGNIAQLLAFGAQHDWAIPEGQTIFDIWARGRTPRSISDMRRKINAQAITFMTIPWNEWLPEKIPIPLSSPTEDVKHVLST